MRIVSETDFPYGQIADKHAEEYILPWFKRCLEDTPSAYLSIPWKEWFNRWFSQFIEKGEEK